MRSFCLRDCSQNQPRLSDTEKTQLEKYMTNITAEDGDTRHKSLLGLVKAGEFSLDRPN